MYDKGYGKGDPYGNGMGKGMGPAGSGIWQDPMASGYGPMSMPKGGHRYEPYEQPPMQVPPQQAAPAPIEENIRTKIDIFKMDEFCCKAIATLTGRPTHISGTPPALGPDVRIEQRTKIEHLRTHLEKAKRNFYTYTLAAAEMVDCPGYDSLCDYFKSKKRVGLLQRDNCYLYLVPPEAGFALELDLPEVNFLLGIVIPNYGARQ